MESHVVKTCKRMDDARNHVFTRMLLHMKKSSLKIKSALNLALNSLGADVHNILAAFNGIDYPRIADVTRVTGLTATLGKECGFIKDNLESPLALGA